MPGKNECLGKIQTQSCVFRIIGMCRARRKERFLPFGYGVSAHVEGSSCDLSDIRIVSAIGRNGHYGGGLLVAHRRGRSIKITGDLTNRRTQAYEKSLLLSVHPDARTVPDGIPRRILCAIQASILLGQFDTGRIAQSFIERHFEHSQLSQVKKLKEF
jgi:hypothetical protein